MDWMPAPMPGVERKMLDRIGGFGTGRDQDTLDRGAQRVGALSQMGDGVRFHVNSPVCQKVATRIARSFHEPMRSLAANRLIAGDIALERIKRGRRERWVADQFLKRTMPLVRKRKRQ